MSTVADQKKAALEELKRIVQIKCLELDAVVKQQINLKTQARRPRGGNFQYLRKDQAIGERYIEETIKLHSNKCVQLRPLEQR